MCIFQLLQKVKEGKVSEEKFMALMRLTENIKDREDFNSREEELDKILDMK